MSNELPIYSDTQAQIWFYYTRGMIQGLCTEHKVPISAQLSMIDQFNKIGPKLNINKRDLRTRLI